MKKLLVAIAAMTLAVFAAPAFAATNPFTDVPASHWAYDAVAQLASRGVISGYPDGTFKGPQPATRYEIASIIARGLAHVDMDKASEREIEMIRRLMSEFSDELSVLGVTVDGLDGRLGQLEKDLGGWRISGAFEFNAKFGEDRAIGDADFQLDKYRIFLDRRINRSTRFHARLGSSGSGLSDDESGVSWDYYYITAKLGYGINFSAGRFGWDWESQYGLRADDDSLMGDMTNQGLGFEKDWGIAKLALLITRRNDDQGSSVTRVGGVDIYDFSEATRISANVNVDFNEKVSGGLMGYFDLADEGDWNITTIGLYAKYRFHPSVELKGLYYFQSLDDYYTFRGSNVIGYPSIDPTPIADYEDSPAAWRAALEVKQDLLKFTSLWLEYAQIDNTFRPDHIPYRSLDRGPIQMMNPSLPLIEQGIGRNGTSQIVLVKAAQKWNEKWDSWIRYNWVDWDTAGVYDFSQYGVGIGYQLNPEVHFELAYDHADWGTTYTNAAGEVVKGDDDMVRFQTLVRF